VTSGIDGASRNVVGIGLERQPQYRNGLTPQIATNRICDLDRHLIPGVAPSVPELEGWELTAPPCPAHHREPHRRGKAIDPAVGAEHSGNLE
jgi:hypothetical protein